MKRPAKRPRAVAASKRTSVPPAAGAAHWLPPFEFTAHKRTQLRKLIAKTVPRPKREDIDGIIRDVEGIIRTWRGFQQGEERGPSKAEMRKEIAKINEAGESFRLAIRTASPGTRDLLNQSIFRVGKHGMAARPELSYPKLGDPWLERVLSDQVGYALLACRQLLKQQSGRGAPGKRFETVAISRIAAAFEHWTGKRATATKSSVFYQLVEICMDAFGQPIGDLSYLIDKALAQK